MPDNIVFNRFVFFDANFINPSERSIVAAMQGPLSNLFASFQTIATAIFIIAAMVMGLKMALSTIASKKAQYKESTAKFLTGFIILMCLKWILAGIFYINESLVAILFSVSRSSDLTVPVYITEAVPIFGRVLTDLVKVVASLWDGDGAIHVAGYFGIVMSNMTKSIGGDLIASIVGFIIMGQTLTICGSYIKRVFMCVLLGMVSPLIVAADTITSVTGKQSTIFANWLKNFVATVFMQTFHAIYMVVILSVLSKIYAKNSVTGLNPTAIGIITIALTTGLVKMEKMLKGMFGLGDSMAGDLKDGGKGMLKALGAVKGLGAAAGAIKDNAPKMKDAAKRKQAYSTELNKLKGAQSSDNSKAAFAAAKKAKAEGNMDEYHKQMKIAAEARKDAKERGVTFDKKGNSSADAATKTNTSKGGNNANGDYLQQVINAKNNPASMTREQQIQQLEAAIGQETKNYKSAALATVMGPANIAAGIGMGLGMGDDISETLMKGGIITAALDKGTELVGGKMADKDRKTFYEHEKREGEKIGYTPSEKIIREKSVVEKTVKNAVDKKLYIDPIAVGREIGKQFQGVGEILSDTMKKELKHIDRDLDDSQ